MDADLDDAMPWPAEDQSTALPYKHLAPSWQGSLLPSSSWALPRIFRHRGVLQETSLQQKVQLHAAAAATCISAHCSRAHFVSGPMGIQALLEDHIHDLWDLIDADGEPGQHWDVNFEDVMAQVDLQAALPTLIHEGPDALPQPAAAAGFGEVPPDMMAVFGNFAPQPEALAPLPPPQDAAAEIDPNTAGPSARVQTAAPADAHNGAVMLPGLLERIAQPDDGSLDTHGVLPALAWAYAQLDWSDDELGEFAVLRDGLTLQHAEQEDEEPQQGQRGPECEESQLLRSSSHSAPQCAT